MDSDEQIFSTSSFQDDSLTRHFPFIDSILVIIQQLSIEDPPIIFAKVETVFHGLEGIYDYSFSKEIRNEKLVICWQIIDKTEEYTIQKKEQQSRQDKIISSHQK